MTHSCLSPGEESFDFSLENQEKIQKILSHYPAGRHTSAILPLLDLAQRQCGGWLPQGAMDRVAQVLQMPPIRVYEVASFYTMFNLRPVGKYLLQVCTTTPCALRGGEDLFNTCRHHLKIEKDQTTSDGLFTLKEVECLGACVNGPVVQINDDYLEDLTPASLQNLLKDLEEEKPVKPGSLLGRQGSKPFRSPPSPPLKDKG